MSKKKIPELFQMTQRYFLEYLPEQRNSSVHTIRAYQKAIDQLIEFISKRRNVQLWNVDFSMIDSTILADFLDTLEKQGNSIATRNQRLKGIRAFYSYAAMMRSTLMGFCAEINKVPFKKEVSEQVIDYLSEEAIKSLLDLPDVTTKKGIRDQFLLIFMYDSAARVQEVVDVNLKDIHTGKTPVVILHGKGNKVRTVPLMKKTMEHFEYYRSIFHPGETPYSDQPLFYTIRNGTQNRISESTIRKMVGQYGSSVKQSFPDARVSIHPHLLRHSRAMHLYQHGMDLTLISQWLGHANLETTLIYAHADTEYKREAIAKATTSDSPLVDKIHSDRYTVTDEDTLKRLYGLK
jgi:site-specific recombinase XerD